MQIRVGPYRPVMPSLESGIIQFEVFTPQVWHPRTFFVFYDLFCTFSVFKSPSCGLLIHSDTDEDFLSSKALSSQIGEIVLS